MAVIVLAIAACEPKARNDTVQEPPSNATPSRAKIPPILMPRMSGESASMNSPSTLRERTDFAVAIWRIAVADGVGLTLGEVLDSIVDRAQTERVKRALKFGTIDSWIDEFSIASSSATLLTAGEMSGLREELWDKAAKLELCAMVSHDEKMLFAARLRQLERVQAQDAALQTALADVKSPSTRDDIRAHANSYKSTASIDLPLAPAFVGKSAFDELVIRQSRRLGDNQQKIMKRLNEVNEVEAGMGKFFSKGT